MNSFQNFKNFEFWSGGLQSYDRLKFLKYERRLENNNNKIQLNWWFIYIFLNLQTWNMPILFFFKECDRKISYMFTFSM